MPEINIIVAVSEDGYIGKGGEIPWSVPEDLRRFKHLTERKPVVMGRKTRDSILRRNGKLLEGRLNVVLTTNPNQESRNGELYVSSKEAAIDALRAYKEIWIIGGEQVYKEFLEDATRIEMTRVYMNIQGDARFPELGEEWEETLRQRRQGYDFITYEKSR